MPVGGGSEAVPAPTGDRAPCPCQRVAGPSLGLPNLLLTHPLELGWGRESQTGISSPRKRSKPCTGTGGWHWHVSYRE